MDTGDNDKLIAVSRQRAMLLVLMLNGQKLSASGMIENFSKSDVGSKVYFKKINFSSKSFAILNTRHIHMEINLIAVKREITMTAQSYRFRLLPLDDGFSDSGFGRLDPDVDCPAPSVADPFFASLKNFSRPKGSSSSPPAPGAISN